MPEVTISVVCGHCPDSNLFSESDVELIENQKLNYLSKENLTKEFLELEYQKIYSFFVETFNKQDILHLHNLNLGKNPLVTLAAYKLALDGYKIVNHAHDFAEDRPENWEFYKKILHDAFGYDVLDVLYPKLKNYIICTINLADLNRLGDYDYDCNGRFLLPNPVNLSVNSSVNVALSRQKIVDELKLDANKNIVTYPVRVIKRKNIGELILLATLFRDKANFLVTLPPKNPIEVERYIDWKSFCEEHNINIYFEVGERLDFEDVISGSDFCITTSYKEGFGMVYMEPWLMGTPVIGRKIPFIIEELSESNIKFPSLYDEFFVNCTGEIKDFKDFSIDLQKQIIKDALESKQYSDELLEMNPTLKELLAEIPTEIIEHNKRIISETYSLEKFGERLYGIYQRIIR
jgi:glycosyltransferase involved in cell wall biosynthesis